VIYLLVYRSIAAAVELQHHTLYTASKSAIFRTATAQVYELYLRLIIFAELAKESIIEYHGKASTAESSNAVDDQHGG